MSALGDIPRAIYGLWQKSVPVLLLAILLAISSSSVAESTSSIETQYGVTSSNPLSSSVHSKPMPTSALHYSPTSTSVDPLPTPTPIATSDPYMIIANVDVIYRVGLDESNFRPLINDSSLSVKTVAIDYDIRRNILFWSDVKTKRIVKSHLDGSNPRIIIDTDLTVAESLAWDWISQKLYWTDSKHHEIEVADIYTGHRMQLVYTGNETAPRALVLDPNTRYIYWTDWGEVARIERMSMDGTMREVLHDTDLVWPNGITLDYASQMIYWVDAKLDKIESSFTNGSNRRIVSTRHVYHPFAIVFFNNILYWSDWDIDQVIYAQLPSLSIVEGLIPGLDNDPYGLKVISLDAQPIGAENPCGVNNGNCSHLCLPSAASNRSYSCACPRGARLDENGTQCIFDSPTTSPLPSPGSCQGAGYTSCCTSGQCEGHGTPLCFCDSQCLIFEDCCQDFLEICDVNLLNSSDVSLTTSPPQILVTSSPISVSPPATSEAHSLDIPVPSSTGSLSWMLSSSQIILLEMSTELMDRTHTAQDIEGTSVVHEESSRPTAMPSSSEMNLQISSSVSTSSQLPRRSQTTFSTFPDDSDAGQLDGHVLLLGAVGVISFLLLLIVVILSLMLFLCILRRKRSRAMVSSSSFGKYEIFVNSSFHGIGELSRKSSFRESMDSGVDFDMKVYSQV